jgi:uncharacterized protein YkwD
MIKKLLVLSFISTAAYPCDDQKAPQNPTMTKELREMVNMINAERKSKGLHALKVDPKLNCAAQMHSDDIGPKKLCQHDGTDGSSPWDRAKKCGTSGRAENVACGQRNARAAVDAWLNSAGHYKNMMNKNIKYIGVGEKNFFWTNIFR